MRRIGLLVLLVTLTSKVYASSIRDTSMPDIISDVYYQI